MIQVCDPPRQRQVRRLSAEEFFTLVRCGGAGFYRPCSEVLRMLTAGEAWGTAGAALLVLPSSPIPPPQRHCADWLGRRQLEGGCLLTPPVHTGEELPARLVEIAAARADRLRRKGTAWAVVECTETAAALLPLYFRQGFGLRALRPLESPAPCFCCCTGCARAALRRCGCRWRTGYSWRCCWQRAMPRWTAAPTAAVLHWRSIR
ncbi:MAG: hypothetical protein ACLVJH_02745 [Faecalibacterium prausnitzii]